MISSSPDLASPPSGEHPRDQSDDRRDDRARADQQDRGPDAFAHHVDHRTLLGERLAELQPWRVFPVGDELAALPLAVEERVEVKEDGLVEMEQHALLLDLLGRDPALRQQQPGGVARQDPEEDEVERRDQEECQDRVGDLPQKVSSLIHGSSERDSRTKNLSWSRSHSSFHNSNDRIADLQADAR
jgi:hypothetical protein